MILGRQRQDTPARIMLVTNRVCWEGTRVVRCDRGRWTGTATFQRDGQQQLGLGDCQRRSGTGQTRQVYLVMLASSLLRRQLRQGHVHEWASAQRTTIGEACRAILRETPRQTLPWTMERRQHPSWTPERSSPIWASSNRSTTEGIAMQT